MTAWIITKDNVASEEDKAARPEGCSNLHAVGLTGPRTASDRDVARLRAGEGTKFRMLDDDGEIYYYGRILEEDDCSAGYGAYEELAPLDNFGTPNAGCTQIEYKDKDGKWTGLL